MEHEEQPQEENNPARSAMYVPAHVVYLHNFHWTVTTPWRAAEKVETSDPSATAPPSLAEAKDYRVASG